MRFIREQLLPAYQVIYTTHTPFMIDPEHLDGVRTVEDASAGEQVLGTKVGDRFLSTDPDTLFPIRAALAYDVAKRAVVSPQTLLVDRPSDVLYLKWFSRELELQGREHLDPDWSLVPVGGLDSIAPFATLFASPTQRIVVLTDGLMSHPRRLEGLWERGILQFGRILRPALYLDVEQEDAQIEDLLGRAPVPRARQRVLQPQGIRRPVRRMTTWCPDRRPRWWPRSTRTSRPCRPGRRASTASGPRRTCFEHTAELRGTLPELDVALSRFEKLFRDLNSFVVD